MTKRFSDVWCSETGHIGLTDYGVDKEFNSSEFEEFLNGLNDKTTEVRDMLFEIIDNNIIALEKLYEFGQTKAGACPMHNIQYSINVLKDLKREFRDKMLGPLPPFNPSLQLGRCRCVLEPVNIDAVDDSDEKAKRLKEALEGIK